MEKKIEVTIGFKTINENGVETYFGDYTNNGFCYKNIDAFKNGLGVIYIGEYDFQSEICESTNAMLWYRNNWIKYVKEACLNYLEDKINEIQECDFMPFIEFCALQILDECDWQDLTTLLDEKLIYSNDWFNMMLEDFFDK